MIATEEPDVVSRLPAKVIRQPPVKIDTFLSRKEFVLLAQHMMHGNPISHFLTVWQDEKTKRATTAAAAAERNESSRCLKLDRRGY